jgi:hypothetical protein
VPCTALNSLVLVPWATKTSPGPAGNGSAGAAWPGVGAMIAIAAAVSSVAAVIDMALATGLPGLPMRGIVERAGGPRSQDCPQTIQFCPQATNFTRS